ncbi:MAG TPA: tetratricopeptide repeat protein [Bacteroidetes bacterium]|nr:tetratricopeptide repeat protein [Bacteroidota bacterium]
MKTFRSLLLASLALVIVTSYLGCKSTAFTSAKLYLQQENYPKAIQFLEQETAQNPQNAEAFYLLGRCYARDKRYKEMNDNFDSSIKISKKYEKEINITRKKYWIDSFNTGVRDLQNQKPENAVKDFEIALTIDPKSADTYKNMAFAYIRLNNHDKAVENYKKAIELDSNDTKSMLALGMEYYNTKKYNECIAIMKKLLEKDPENKDAVSYLALSYDLMGNREKALEAYANALAKNPKDSDLYFNRGRLFYNANDYVNAAKNFEKVAQLSPEDFDAIYNVGNTYLSIGNNLQKERKALEKKNGDEKKINDLKTQEMANYKKALTYLEKAVKLNPEHHNAWYNLAVTYVRLGMVEKGKEAFAKSDELEKK